MQHLPLARVRLPVAVQRLAHLPLLLSRAEPGRRAGRLVQAGRGPPALLESVHRAVREAEAHRHHAEHRDVPRQQEIKLIFVDQRHTS